MLKIGSLRLTSCSRSAQTRVKHLTELLVSSSTYLHPYFHVIVVTIAIEISQDSSIGKLINQLSKEYTHCTLGPEINQVQNVML